MRAIIVDGYIDEPGCLGVPPYLATYPRYIHGVLTSSNIFDAIDYITVDQLRIDVNIDKITHLDHELALFVSGVSVPGNYIGGKPISFRELQRFSKLFPKANRILCGPAARFGIGQEGGKPSIPSTRLLDDFELIITGDAEVVLDRILNDEKGFSFENIAYAREYASIERCSESLASVDQWAIKGAALIRQHPNFSWGLGKHEGGNLICEIETFRGCPRFRSGGCSFCVEPTKGATVHRSIDGITSEVEALYEQGARNFRLGNQTDFYAYQHGQYENPRYPRPNPGAIETLLRNIREACPGLKTLHIDNVNALHLALYPQEAREITRSIVRHCTAGNVAAIGVESVDPVVIQKNNLKASKEEILSAIRAINEEGKEIGPNGNPRFLPGLNFITGLPGETRTTLDQNLAFLKDVHREGLLLRRINIRRLLPPASILHDPSVIKDFTATLRKNEKWHVPWKDKVRDEIDMPMLRQVLPAGTVLTGAWAELHEGNGTYCRQVGTYPILCYVPRTITLHDTVDLRVIDHGYRSVTCLIVPVNVLELSINELEHVPGIGRKRAMRILNDRPRSTDDWLRIFNQNKDELHQVEKIIGNLS